MHDVSFPVASARLTPGWGDGGGQGEEEGEATFNTATRNNKGFSTAARDGLGVRLCPGVGFLEPNEVNR